MGLIGFYTGKAVSEKRVAHNTIRLLKGALLRDAAQGKKPHDIIDDAKNDEPGSDLQEALKVLNRFKG